jgi:hypothetical protein
LVFFFFSIIPLCINSLCFCESLFVSGGKLILYLFFNQFVHLLCVLSGVSGPNESGKKKILLLKGKEREISNVSFFSSYQSHVITWGTFPITYLFYVISMNREFLFIYLF